MSQIDLYGLKNCDGCRKALRTFEAQDHTVVFHDIREPENTRTVVAWIKGHNDWLAFVNRRSTTWRNLDDADKADLTHARALKLLAQHPTLIKRPVLRIGNVTLAGFSQDAVDAALT